jgi:hypothetical protein
MPFTKDMALLERDGNAGLVTTTAGPDLLHTLPTGRSLRVTKVMVFNNTGANVTIQLGTLTNAGAFVGLLPSMLCINTMENVWNKIDLPSVEFVVNSLAGALGRTGSVYVQATAVGAIVSIEVEEKI